MKDNKPKFSDFLVLVQLILVGLFLVGALVFMIVQLGWKGFAGLALFGALFLPMLLAPALKKTRRKKADDNFFLNPIYKGWLGNIFTKK
ncbi:hypothetical protein [Geomonas subterranea]|uniref:hypothetical protein n=1 Tax=Geomonas subterranea TaxID=2847989 RepID=UPI001CD58DAB|nr:hypothetical protein [Geomonas fuzhouensis]